MSGIKVDILWSPNHQNRFITFGTELHLYQVEEVRTGNYKPSAISLSDSTVATLLSTNSDNQYMKCVSWYPKAQHDHLLAVGQASGKVVLTSFEDRSDHSDLVGREFIPKHGRQCNCVSWNPVESNLLAAGLDKCRTDHGVLIWDVMKPLYTTGVVEGSGIGSDKRHSQSGAFSTDTFNVISKPFVELGMSEVVHSLHWFTHTPKIIVCGMNNKHIKIYDLRDLAKHQNSTATKAVYGVCVDPLCEHRLASFVENLVVIWDVRNFEKPVVTFHEAKQIVKQSWCPMRCGLLAALPKDSSTLKLYDIQQAPLGNDEVEPAVVERSIQPFNQRIICSFAWHPSQENRMLTVTPNNDISDYTVFDRITLNWSPTSEIVWTYGRKVLQCIDCRDDFYASLDDISVKMRKRACAGYGLKMNQLWQNGELSDDPHLFNLWTWLDLVKSIQEEKRRSGNKCLQKYEGVYSLVCGDSGSTISRSEAMKMPWVGLNTSGVRTTKYISEEREKALQLCGWGAESDSTNLTLLLERLEMDGFFTKAAAIAIFNLEMRRAIQILNRGATLQSTLGRVTDLNAIAMALSGYTEDKNALWREISSNLRPQLTDPYLRAMFAFITTEGDGYEEVVNEISIAVQDRVAFACIFLPDKKLAELLARLKTKMIETGNLEGILLTGLTSDGLTLLQRYVDITGDVQTASLIVLHSLPSTIAQDSRTQLWVESYRQLLDTWRLWKQRAMFDVLWFKASTAASRPPQQVFVSCNFCGKSVSNFLQLRSSCHGQRLPPMAITPANKFKVTCCPGCRKPLPRCALCLTHMGTPAGIHWRRATEEKSDKKKLTEFSNWLTWCQLCRHGGHSIHIVEWFEKHAECPITGCTCKCMSLDAVAKIESAINE